MERVKRLFISVAAGVGIALLTALPTVAGNTTGVTDTEIKIGNTNPYSGPASVYSTIGKAITAYFNMVNEKGGINGRKINFVTLDDAYSPPKTVEQVRKLVEREKVFALFQTLGTPTNSAIHKYVNKKKVPHLFVATGATKWGDPENYPWTMGWQPSYQTEGAIYAHYLRQHKPDAKVAILYQNDDYGKDYVLGFKNALGDKAKSMVVAEQTYEVLDPKIDSQIVNLKASGADVFYNVTIPKFAAQAIRKVHDLGWKPLHLLNSVSASVGSVLQPAGLEKSQGIVSATYIMDPTDPAWHSHPDYKAWLAFMEKYYPEGDRKSPFNAYAYAVTATFIKVLEQCGNDLSRENLMKQAANLKDLRVPMLLPGIVIHTAPNDFRPIEQMQMQRFEGETFVRFGEVISAN